MSSKPEIAFFTSYAHADTALVQSLLALLDTNFKASAHHQYRRWVDHDIIIGDQWAASIQRAMDAADVGLLLVSPAFLASDYISTQELAHFLDPNGQLRVGKRIIPVALKNIDMGAMDVKGLQHRQLFFHKGKSYLECTTSKAKHDFALALFSQIERAMSAPQPSAALVASTPAAVRVVVVQSFTHALDGLPPDCADWLDLRAAFAAEADNRALLPGQDWAGTIYPQLYALLARAAQAGPHLRLVLQCHSTLAFTTGSILDSKSRRVVEVAQTGLAAHAPAWRADTGGHDPAWRHWQFIPTEIDPAVGDMAIGVSLTRDTQAGVMQYLQESGLTLGRHIHARIGDQPSNQSVQSGRHAFELATQLAQMIRDQRSARAMGAQHTIHLFIAAPNGFMFFLGQMQNGMGRVQLYEFDFGRSNRYVPSLRLPLA